VVTTRARRSSGRRWRALDRKLLRDLDTMKGQALAIALVIAAGISVFVSMFSTFTSLDLSLTTYYDRYRFGDVFAAAVRVPLPVAGRLAEIPGVAQVEARVVVNVTIDVPGMADPASGRLISVPADRRPGLCDVFLREGRYLEPRRPDEVLASEGFARAHGLRPGDAVAAVINGRRRELRIVGLALSPEFIYQIRPGELFPDEERFGVFWMDRQSLGAAFQMEGAFNDAVLTLMRGASEPEVIAAVDRVLAPYGGAGAIPRALQVSHWYLANELAQLRTSGILVPVVFLGVAAFLLNVVLSRIVSVQRPQIAAIKALGYGNAAIAVHYVKWSLLVALAGAGLGLLAGVWLGRAMTGLYTWFFHFPILVFDLDARVMLAAVAVAAISATLGALGAVRRAVQLPPAEAMRPEPPARFGVSWMERAGLRRMLSMPARSVLRSMQRHPGRVALSTLGIALGASLLVVSNFSLDAMDLMLDVQFNLAQRYDLAVTFVEPTSSSAVHEIRRLPGVMQAEPFRAVAARVRVGPRSRMVSITGVPADASLNRIVDASFQVVRPRPGGLVLSDKLAELLRVVPGDTVVVEVLEGQRPVRDVPVADVVYEYMGMNVYMEQASLHRIMREGETLSGVYLSVDPSRVDALYRRLKATPRVAGVLIKRAAIDSFMETIAGMMRQMQALYVVFASIIAFGIVYNTARISLAERSRELATLRVIGFTRAEVSSILLGELVVVTLVAVPLGLWMGYGMAGALVTAMDTEMWRLPLVVSAGTYVYAAAAIVVATTLSALVARRRLERLDLVEVLKTRE
jgi:putative ABC transport system permease protein